MNVIDLHQTQEDDVWSAFRELLHEAQTGSDRNARNYQTLRVDTHDAFHVLLDEGKAIAFAGVYNNDIYPSSIARVLNRAYYAKSVRQTGLPTNKDGRQAGGLLARYVLPEQITVAKQKRKAIFFSVEFNRRRRTIDAVTRWINKYDSKNGEMWQAYQDMYFTCPPFEECREDSTCWQNVSVLSFEEGFEFPLPRMTRDEWLQRFDN